MRVWSLLLVAACANPPTSPSSSTSEPDRGLAGGVWGGACAADYTFTTEGGSGAVLTAPASFTVDGTLDLTDDDGDLSGSFRLTGTGTLAASTTTTTTLAWSMSGTRSGDELHLDYVGPTTSTGYTMSGPSPVQLDLVLGGDTLTGTMTWRGLSTLDSGEPLPLDCAFDR